MPGSDSDFYLSLPEDVSSVKWKVAGGRYHCEPGAATGTILPDWRSQSEDRHTHRHSCKGAESLFTQYK